MSDIKTDRLLLKPLTLEHADSILPIWSDEDVVQYTTVHSINNVEDCKTRLSHMIEGSKSRGDIGPYAIFSADELIGIVSAHRELLFGYALWYHIGKRHWGYGYTTEAAKAVIDRVFSTTEAVRISAETVTTNAASVRVLEKLGMKNEGCLRMKFHRKGVFRDFYSYSIIREEYFSERFVRD